MARKTSNRPKRFRVGPIACRVVRGPHKKDSASWYWRATVERDGDRHNIWTGWGTETDAQAKVAAMLAEGDPVEMAEQAKAEKQAEATGQGTAIVTVRDLVECYASSQKARFEAGDLTKYGYRNSRNDCRHLANGLGLVQLDRLDGTQIENFRNAQLKAGCAPSSVHRQLKCLRAAWAWGRSIGACEARELPKVGVKVKPVRDKHTPSQSDIQAVIEVMPSGSWWRWVTEMLSETGARVGEIAKLTWGDIDWRNETVTLTGKEKSRKFFFTPEVRRLLDSAPNQDSGLLHGTTETMVRGHLSSRQLKAACEKAGVRRFSAHGLRRAAVDALARAGVDTGTAADIIGHSPETMLKAYRQVSDADRRAGTLALAAARRDGNVIPFPRGKVASE